MDEIKLLAPEGVGSISLAGVEYVAADGVVTLPVEQAVNAYAFGFVNAPDNSAAKAAAEAEAARVAAEQAEAERLAAEEAEKAAAEEASPAPAAEAKPAKAKR